MKLRRFLFAFLISLAAFQFCFSQEKPKAVLFDEFEKVTCEELMARLDAFFIDLMDDPNSQGYSVIYGKTGDLFENLRYEQWTNGYINFRQYEKSRLIVIKGKDRENFKIEFWKVPAGAETPSFFESKWSYILPESTKPFIFTAYRYQDGICPSTSYVKLFADFLTANSNARGNIVIRDKTNKHFLKRKNEVLAELVKQYKVSPNRLKFFYVVEKDYQFDFIDVEFWFVPKKKK